MTCPASLPANVESCRRLSLTLKKCAAGLFCQVSIPFSLLYLKHSFKYLIHTSGLSLTDALFHFPGASLLPIPVYTGIAVLFLILDFLHVVDEILTLLWLRYTINKRLRSFLSVTCHNLCGDWTHLVESLHTVTWFDNL